VLLVVAAAAYTIFIQPVDQLVINVSALLLGIWGVRNVLVSPAGPAITAVDLSMSLVMLFLLAAVATRTLIYLYARSGLPMPPPFRGRSGAAPGAAAPDTPRHRSRRSRQDHAATDHGEEADGRAAETLPEAADRHQPNDGRP
jgi:hypothetical protein